MKKGGLVQSNSDHGKNTVSIEQIALNLHLLTNEQIDIAKILDILRGWFNRATFFRDPVKTIRLLENPNFIVRFKMRREIKKILNNQQVYDEYCDTIMRAISYAVSVLSDDQIREIIRLLKGQV